ncbi:hypothetical protein O7634_29650 [Micromonospora sp. WMMD1120]|uniref:hypothetical protein n=1 Tax=Micromonospora sp. WMMD1120 TaxID=3016106 RepID=UPI002416F1E5|nr:hypothetical protein [Micromonospora sp. WMMD1120]MDG4810943.1 hypothetical protein [Micromonospora sp. WMMD1120]
MMADLGGGVVTPDLISTWVAWKRANEVNIAAGLSATRRAALHDALAAYVAAVAGQPACPPKRAWTSLG